MSVGTTTNPNAGDYGFKVAQAGISVYNASDYQLLFNSAWPSLTIAFQKTVTNAVYGQGVPHGLGFPPLTMTWVSQKGVILYRYFNDIDNTNVYINDTNIDPSYVYDTVCYNLDITKAQSSTFFAPPSTPAPYSRDYGFKVPLPGRKIESTDLRDFIVHTRAQSPAVLTVNTTLLNDGTIVYSNAQNYTCWVFGYGNAPSSNLYVWANPYNQSIPGIFITNNLFRLQLTTGWTGSLVVLRDPLFAPNNIQVQY
jgi:hypothetical protein